MSEQLKFLLDNRGGASLACRNGEGERKVIRYPVALTHALALEVTDSPGCVSVGLGARTPGETAMSIGAEVIATAPDRSERRLRDTTTAIHP